MSAPFIGRKNELKTLNKLFKKTPQVLWLLWAVGGLEKVA